MLPDTEMESGLALQGDGDDGFVVGGGGSTATAANPPYTVLHKYTILPLMLLVNSL